MKIRSRACAIGCAVIGLLAVSGVQTTALAATSGSGTSLMATSDGTQAKAKIVVDSVHQADPIRLVAKDPLGQNQTTWVPLCYLQQALAAAGVKTMWNGRDLTVVPPTTWTIPEVAPMIRVLLKKHEMDFLMGGGQYNIAPTITQTDPASGKITTYVPIYYVNQFLQNELGAQTNWDGTTWTINTQNALVPSNVVNSVMKQTVEAKDSTESFTPGGKQVIVSDGSGGTLQAILGTRYPTADGLGQLVFFFHNGQFVGLNANEEATAILSIKPAGTGVIQVTYANYAPTDAMVNPTLPPQTVTYTWNAGQMVPSSALESGVTTGAEVTAPSSASASDSGN